MDKRLEAKIAEAARVLRAAGAREVYVFGSVVRKRSTPPQDVDLAVSGLPPEVFFEAYADASDALDMPLDLVDLDEENPFVRYLKDEGKLLRVE
jgi:predicted nucleotidyltransferase